MFECFKLIYGNISVTVRHRRTMKEEIHTCSSHNNVSDFSVLTKLLLWSVTVRNCNCGITCNRNNIYCLYYTYQTLCVNTDETSMPSNQPPGLS